MAMMRLRIASRRPIGGCAWGSPRTMAMIEAMRSEEHTSELQSQSNLVCRLLLEKKNTNTHIPPPAQPAFRPYPYPVQPVVRRTFLSGAVLFDPSQVQVNDHGRGGHTAQLLTLSD